MIKFNLKLSTRLEHFGEYCVYTHVPKLAWCSDKEKAKKVIKELIKFMKKWEEE